MLFHSGCEMCRRSLGYQCTVIMLGERECFGFDSGWLLFILFIIFVAIRAVEIPIVALSKAGGDYRRDFFPYVHIYPHFPDSVREYEAALFDCYVHLSVLFNGDVRYCELVDSRAGLLCQRPLRCARNGDIVNRQTRYVLVEGKCQLCSKRGVGTVSCEGHEVNLCCAHKLYGFSGVSCSVRAHENSVTVRV